MDSEKPKIKDIAFNFTGFGPFLHIKNNPSGELIQSIKTWLDKEELRFKISDARVLNVAAQDCREYVDHITASIEEQKRSSPEIRQVIVHMGVDDEAEQIHFEVNGYNNADFGGPDNRGYKPKKEKINKALQLDHELRTGLPVEEICDALKTNHSIGLSTDPGRYICNYIYYLSLNNSNIKDIPAVFIHVPDFSKVDKEDQEAFLMDFMKVTREILLRGGDKSRKNAKQEVQINKKLNKAN